MLPIFKMEYSEKHTVYSRQRTHKQVIRKEKVFTPESRIKSLAHFRTKSAMATKNGEEYSRNRSSLCTTHTRYSIWLDVIQTSRIYSSSAKGNKMYSYSTIRNKNQ